MIRFRLCCPGDHQFEGWFASSEAFNEQRRDRLLVCPVCGAHDVSKAIMAPAIAHSPRRETVPVAANVADRPAAVEMLRRMRKHLTENADYVGSRFAEEARRIHYEEADKRGIYGEASADDVRSLVSEGIEFHPLPVLPEDHN